MFLISLHETSFFNTNNYLFQPCSSTHASATGEWSPEKMKEKLNSMTDTVCGFHKKVPCLKNGREYFNGV